MIPVFGLPGRNRSSIPGGRRSWTESRLFGLNPSLGTLLRTNHCKISGWVRPSVSYENLIVHVGEFIYGSLFLVTLWGWVHLARRWSKELQHARALAAMAGSSLPVFLAIATLAYVDFVRPRPSTDYTVERVGLALSAVAIATATRSLKCTEGWIPKLTLTVSIAIFTLYLLAGMTV